RSGGAGARADQHDARRFTEPLAAANAAARVAAGGRGRGCLAGAAGDGALTGTKPMVTLNRIYTRTGDDGTTALGTGEGRPKYDLRVSAYGTVDETNAAIGVARLHVPPASPVLAMLGLIQNDLFDVGADLAVPDRPGKAERLRIVDTQVERLERDIDSLN